MAPKCIHQEVCGHFFTKDQPDLCAVNNVCKYYESLIKEKISTDKASKRRYTKRGKPDDDAVVNEDGITEKQFKKARKKIANAQQQKRLSDNQKLALTTLKGLRFKTMTEAQREQIVSIAKDL